MKDRISTIQLLLGISFLGFVVLGVVGIKLSAAKREYPERYYQQIWCNEHNGQVEVVLADGTRCDCLTTTHAIEFDFGYKWAEAIGQSLNYSLQTGKRAGIVLIMGDNDRRYYNRLCRVVEYFNLPIDVWRVTSGD
jgi:hypothetical protein